MLACGLCFAAGAVAVAIGNPPQPFKQASPKAYVADDGTRIAGTGITGAGLPDLGKSSGYGIGELAQAARDYHDSGAYDRDVAKVANRARGSVRKQLSRLAHNRGPGRYSVCRHGDCERVKPAIVLDIDETSLSNYQGLNAVAFSQTGVVAGSVAGNDPAIAPTLKLYEMARRKHVRVAFVTGRPELVRGPTNSNLHNVGYDEGYSLSLKPSGPTTIAYKSGERRRLTKKKGFTIIANVGDQDSDLQGGFAKRSFKLPNPFYFIP